MSTEGVSLAPLTRATTKAFRSSDGAPVKLKCWGGNVEENGVFVCSHQDYNPKDYRSTMCRHFRYGQWRPKVEG